MNPITDRETHDTLEGTYVAVDPVEHVGRAGILQCETYDAPRDPVDEALGLREIDRQPDLFPDPKRNHWLQTALLDELFHLLRQRCLALGVARHARVPARWNVILLPHGPCEGHIPGIVRGDD